MSFGIRVGMRPAGEKGQSAAWPGTAWRRGLPAEKDSGRGTTAVCVASFEES